MTRSLYGRDGMGWSRRCGLRYLMRSSRHSRNEPWRPSRSARLGFEPSSTLRDAQRPYSRQWIPLGSPGDARLPQTVAPFRRERRTFFVAPVPVDDLVDSDPVPGDRDHERIPHTRRRFCRLLVVEERGVGSLGHPPDDEIVRRHATPTLPPRRAVGRHVQYRPRTRCSWRSHTSSRSGESTSHASGGTGRYGSGGPGGYRNQHRKRSPLTPPLLEDKPIGKTLAGLDKPPAGRTHCKGGSRCKPTAFRNARPAPSSWRWRLRSEWSR